MLHGKRDSADIIGVADPKMECLLALSNALCQGFETGEGLAWPL